MKGSVRPRFCVLSPCGTSLFTNQATPELRRFLFEVTNLSEAEIAGEYPERIEEVRKYVERCTRGLAGYSYGDDAVLRLSAELHSLARWFREHGVSKEDVHILLASDTYLGRKSAEAVKGWLERQGVGQVMIHVQRDLKTSTNEEFQLAVTELLEQVLFRWIREYRAKGYRVIFNLTGGFKAVLAFLQSVAPLYADECVYVFEESRELIRIPRLPLRLDVKDVILRYLRVFRRLAQGLQVTEEECTGLNEVFLTTLSLEEGKEIGFSAWGKIIWEEVKEEVYRERVWDPPSQLIEWSEKFRRQVEDLPAERRYVLNVRMDDLARYLEVERPQGIREKNRLDLKGLPGNPKPPSTHEIDAWHDQDARRLFVHFEKREGREVCVIDELGKGLGH